MTHLLATTDAFIDAHRRAADHSLPLRFPRTGDPRFALYIPALDYSETVIKELARIVINKLIDTDVTYTRAIIDAAKARFADLLLTNLAKGGETRLAKRVASVVKKEWGKNLETHELDAIGNLDGILKARTVYVDVTNVLDWKAGDFGDHKSCFFTCHSDHRTVLHPQMGTVALRFWEGLEDTAKGTGRILIVPLMHNVAGYVATNAYGATMTGVVDGLPTIGQRAALAILVGASGVRWQYNDCRAYLGGTYVNPRPVVITAHDVMVDKDIDIHGTILKPEWMGKARSTGNRSCDSCGDTFHSDDLTRTHHGTRICEGCLDDRYTFCEDVNAYVHEDYVRYSPDDDEPMHEDTWENRCASCETCDNCMWLDAQTASNYGYNRRSAHNYAHTVVDDSGYDRMICTHCYTTLAETAIDGTTYLVRLSNQWRTHPRVATLHRATITGEYARHAHELTRAILPDGTQGTISPALARQYGHALPDGTWVLDTRAGNWTPYDNATLESVELLPCTEGVFA